MPERLRAGRAVLALTAVAALATGCAVGPAAHRAEREGTDRAAATAEPGAAGGSSGAPGRVPEPSARPSASPPPAQGSAEIAGTYAGPLGAACCLAALPHGEWLVGEEDGSLVHVGQDGTVTPLGSPRRATRLLGLAVAPDFAGDGDWLYVFYATGSTATVERYLYHGSASAGEQLGTVPDVLLDGIPTGPEHGGGGLAFGPDGDLYVATGDAGQPALAADASSLAGKILRLTPEGGVAPGNPFPDSPVYSLGHAEPTGLAWDEQGVLWVADSGRPSGVELNSIAPGGTYGEGADPQQGTAPVHTWENPEMLAGGLAYAQGCLWLPDAPNGLLWRIPLNGTQLVADPQQVLVGDLDWPIAVAGAPAGSASAGNELALLEAVDGTLLRLLID